MEDLNGMYLNSTLNKHKTLFANRQNKINYKLKLKRSIQPNK